MSAPGPGVARRAIHQDCEAAAPRRYSYQHIQVNKPPPILLPPSSILLPPARIQDILDKGRGMVLLVEVESRDESGDLVLVNQLSIFVVGGGGFGGSRSSSASIAVATSPDRRPDATARYATSKDQAALYRLAQTSPYFFVPTVFTARPRRSKRHK